MSHNRLISIEGLDRLRNLECLNVSYNYVGDDQIALLKTIRSLKSLDISHNHLRDFDINDLLDSLTNLEELINLSNDFVSLTFDAPLARLQKIALDNNKLVSLTFEHNLRSLSVLSVRENSLTRI